MLLRGFAPMAAWLSKLLLMGYALLRRAPFCKNQLPRTGTLGFGLALCKTFGADVRRVQVTIERNYSWLEISLSCLRVLMLYRI